MTNRNNIGQYSKKPKGVLALVIIMVAIGIGLYLVGDTKTIVEVAVNDTVATEDPRIAEYLASEEAKLQARLSIYEKDRLDAIQTNKGNNAQIETEYKASLKAEMERNAKAMLKINGNLDEVRKAQLGKSN